MKLKRCLSDAVFHTESNGDIFMFISNIQRPENAFTISTCIIRRFFDHLSIIIIIISLFSPTTVRWALRWRLKTGHSLQDAHTYIRTRVQVKKAAWRVWGTIQKWPSYHHTTFLVATKILIKLKNRRIVCTFAKCIERKTVHTCPVF